MTVRVIQLTTWKCSISTKDDVRTEKMQKVNCLRNVSEEKRQDQTEFWPSKS